MAHPGSEMALPENFLRKNIGNFHINRSIMGTHMNSSKGRSVTQPKGEAAVSDDSHQQVTKSWLHHSDCLQTSGKHLSLSLSVELSRATPPLAPHGTGDFADFYRCRRHCRMIVWDFSLFSLSDFKAKRSSSLF